MQKSPMPLSEVTISTSKDLYSQIVPHFILQQFGWVPSDRLRQKIRNLWRIHKATGEQVFVYDLATCRLQQRPIPRHQSKLDDQTDLKSLLKDLEDKAASIVRAIHYGLGAGRVTLSREGLSDLRRFFFVTHLRGLAVHIQEAYSARGEAKKPASSQSSMEASALLQDLKYCLETRHYDLILTGESLRERYGNPRLRHMLENRSYPDSDRLAFEYALPYEHLANKYFLGIWVAAEESEFVLSGHAFSLREGLINGHPDAHRLHILSPRIAIILRRTCLRDLQFRHQSVLHSSLADIPILPPDIRYADPDLIDILEADPAQAKSVMDAYRATLDAERDSFRYLFTRLNRQQTYAVNEVIMMNTNLRHASVIFRRPTVMQETVKLYLASPNTYLGKKQNWFRPLLTQLAEPGSPIGPERSQTHSSPLPDRESQSASDCQLNLLLAFTILNLVTFPSTYTQAFLIFHMATIASSSNPISLRMHEIRNTAVGHLRNFLDPALPDTLQTSSNGLVLSLASEDSEIFFSLIVNLLDEANANIRPSHDFVASLISDAAIIGVTYWLEEERPDVLRNILVPWVHIWA